jgi:hypothetical protein
MNPAPTFRRCSALLVLTVASIAVTSARAVELTANSPFAPPPTSGADAGATPANSPLELHGILATPDGYKFNLCDQAGHINVWIGLNATGQPFVVRSHDSAHHRVTVEYQGRELTLSLAQPKVSALPQQAMPMPQMGGVTTAQPGAGSPNPQDERMRLERIAEEIRRRRAMRAAAQQPQQFPPGAVNRVPTPPQP